MTIIRAIQVTPGAPRLVASTNVKVGFPSSTQFNPVAKSTNREWVVGMGGIGKGKEERVGGEIIVETRDSHAKHPFARSQPAQSLGTTAMHP